MKKYVKDPTVEPKNSLSQAFPNLAYILLFAPVGPWTKHTVCSGHVFTGRQSSNELPVVLSLLLLAGSGTVIGCLFQMMQLTCIPNLGSLVGARMFTLFSFCKD